MLAAGLRGLPGRASLLGRGHPSLVPARGRKTRFDPPAKSKADRIKVPPPVDPAELLVVLDRYEQYRRVVGAIRKRSAFFRAALPTCQSCPRP